MVFRFYYYCFLPCRIKSLLICFSGAKIFIFLSASAGESKWTRRWDGLEQDVLLQQDDDMRMSISLRWTSRRFFETSATLRVDGLPLLIIYRPPIIPDFDRRLTRWR